MAKRKVSRPSRGHASRRAPRRAPALRAPALPAPREVRAALETWQRTGDARQLTRVAEALRSENPDTRYAAMYALTAAGPTAVPPLVRSLDDSRARWPALRVLHDLAPPDMKTKDSVQKLLGTADARVRHLAHRTLRRVIGAAPPEEVWQRMTSVSGRAASLTTIIHGTWAEDDPWWRWPDRLPTYLDSVTHDVYRGADPFHWSGDNTHDAREKAARALITWLAEHPVDRVRLVAHSHGGNVVFKATELASAGEIQINLLVLLGTPMRDDYLPDLGKIRKVLNVYSEDDVVQWLGAFGHWRDDGRRLPDGSQITNLQVATRTSAPHSELHTEKLWQREGVESAVRESLP